MDPQSHDEPTPETDLQAQYRAHERKEMLAAGMLALPNLFLRSAFTLAILYGMLGASCVVGFDGHVGRRDVRLGQNNPLEGEVYEVDHLGLAAIIHLECLLKSPLGDQ